MKNITLLFIALFAFGISFSQEQKLSEIPQSPNLNMDNQIEQFDISQNIFQRDDNDLIVSGGDCNIGNEIDPGWDSGTYSANYLLGVNFTLADEGTLNSINLIGNGTGANVQMAVYDDNAGVPNDLVIYSGVTTVGSGIVSLPVTATQLLPGDYWIMAIFDVGGPHSDVGQNIDGSVVYYVDLPFGDPIPTNASGFLTYGGQDFLYFLDITCGLGVEDNINDLVSIYPNPVKNRINLEIPSNIEVINSALYDLLGKDTGLRLENNSMNTTNLEKGIYLLTIETSSGSLTKKVIKN